MDAAPNPPTVVGVVDPLTEVLPKENGAAAAAGLLAVGVLTPKGDAAAAAAADGAPNGLAGLLSLPFAALVAPKAKLGVEDDVAGAADFAVDDGAPNENGVGAAVELFFSTVEVADGAPKVKGAGDDDVFCFSFAAAAAAGAPKENGAGADSFFSADGAPNANGAGALFFDAGAPNENGVADEPSFFSLALEPEVVGGAPKENGAGAAAAVVLLFVSAVVDAGAPNEKRAGFAV